RQRIVHLPAPTAADAATYELARSPTTVRLIRDGTPAGSVRILMTSLLDEVHYPAAAFGALSLGDFRWSYHRRWRIEEAFKRIKHRLRLEAATGLTHLAFQQDFAAKIAADNLHGLLAQNTAAIEPDPVTPTSRPNRTYAIGTLKPILAGCLLLLRHCLDGLAAALDAIACTRCRVQPGRAYPRPARTKPHTYSAYKLCC
ncbi:transposase IS4 family protein, partial [mine drainage metagenome]